MTAICAAVGEIPSVPPATVSQIYYISHEKLVRCMGEVKIIGVSEICDIMEKTGFKERMNEVRKIQALKWILES